MKIELKASSQRRAHTDRFGQPAVRIQHVVEVIIDGITFTHDCDTAEGAQRLVVHLSHVMGIK